MSAKNKQDLKQEFLSGSKITQAKLESLIDSSVNKVDDLSIDANGNVGIGTTSPSAKLHIEGENPEFLIKGTSDSNNATLNIYGSVQGTGRVYVGQSSIFGGGIEYNGDGSPGTTDAGKDYITLWRRNGYEDEGERDHWTARNQYNSNDWEFQGKLKATEFEGDGSKLTNLSVGLNGLNLATESGNVGIGTTSPSAKLDVSGNIKSTGTDFFLDNESRRNNEGGSYRRALVHNNNDVLTINYGSDYTGGVNIQGNVGIGTSIPNNKLDVRGQLGVNTTGGDNNWIQWWTDDDDDHPAHIWSSNRRMRFGTWDGWTNKSSWSEKVCITGNGNVGIGITNPSAKLEVAGNTSLGGTLAVTGATTLNSDLTVTGNLTVNGTTTTIDSQNHVVNDSLMELGNGIAGAPINDSGIIIERGTSENVFIGWVESANKFTVGATTATGLLQEI